MEFLHMKIFIATLVSLFYAFLFILTLPLSMRLGFWGPSGYVLYHETFLSLLMILIFAFAYIFSLSKIFTSIKQNHIYIQCVCLIIVCIVHYILWAYTTNNL